MKIEEITSANTIPEIIKYITDTKDDKHVETLKKLKEEWDVSSHRVMIDQEFLPDKDIKDASGNIVRKKSVNRISVPYQKMIVNRLVSFGFANDVQIMDNSEDDSGMTALADAVKRVLFENKESSFNRKIARDLYRGKETAEIWYFQKTEQEHELYGFKTPYRIRCMQLSSWKNDILYPIFDEYENLSAFAREYLITVESKPVTKMDVYTDTETRRFVKGSSDWVEEPIENNGSAILNKIPIIYAHQEQADWEDVRSNIERLELLLSKHAEINDYHAAPKVFVKGELKSMPVAGETNPVLKGGIDSDMKILSWEAAPESVKLEIETLIDNIHKFTQTADISFKNIKGLSQVSGVMLKMLFMDVQLKIMEKNEIWDEYFTRRYNLIKSMLSALNPKFQDASANLELIPYIKPFMISDEKEAIETLMTANGNAPIISRKTALVLADLVDDPNAEMRQIVEEENEALNRDMSDPMNV